MRKKEGPVKSYKNKMSGKAALREECKQNKIRE